MEVDRNSKERSWIWGVLLFVMGAFYLVDWLRDPNGSLFRLLAGAGFLLASPHAFFYPKNFWKPFPRPTNFTGWLSFLGLLLLIAGLVVRFV